MKNHGLKSSFTHRILSLYNVSHGGNNTITPLEGLRALAAFMVFIVHYSAQFTPWIDTNSITWNLIPYYRHIGAKGVELFFIISGFLIYGMLMKKDVSFPIYLKRRLRRIYPTFLVVISVYILLSFLFPGESKLPGSISETISYIVLNIFMIPGVFPIEPIMTVSWTLSYEMFFYLSVPLIICILQFKNWKSLNRILFLGLVSLFGFIAVHLGYDSHCKILYFISGMILFEIYALKDIQQHLTFKFILPISFLLVFLTQYFNLPYLFELIFIFFTFNLVCITTFNTKTTLSKVFSSSILRCYGNMSYSYYLIHGLTLKFLFLVLSHFIPANHQWDWALYYLIIPMFITTWFTSTGLFLLVEKPLSLTKNRPLQAMQEN